MSKKPPSLKRPLIIQPLIFQLAILLLSCTVIMALATRADVGGLYTDESITPVIAQAIVRHRDGGLAVRMTPELAKLRAETPNLWFVVKDDAGRRVTYGQVPRQYASLIEGMGDVSYIGI